MPDVKAKPRGTIAEREAKIAELQAEIVALQAPDPVEYPKWMHKTGEPSVQVADAAAEKALGAGWSDVQKPVEHK